MNGNSFWFLPKICCVCGIEKRGRFFFFKFVFLFSAGRMARVRWIYVPARCSGPPVRIGPSDEKRRAFPVASAMPRKRCKRRRRTLERRESSVEQRAEQQLSPLARTYSHSSRCSYLNNIPNSFAGCCALRISRDSPASHTGRSFAHFATVRGCTHIPCVYVHILLRTYVRFFFFFFHVHTRSRKTTPRPWHSPGVGFISRAFSLITLLGIKSGPHQPAVLRP